MPQADVTQQKLQLEFSFYSLLQNGGATDNSQYQSQTMSLAEIEALDPNLKTLLGALTPLLGTPMGQLFDTAWHNAKASALQTAMQSIEASAKQSGQSISNAVLTAPDTGPVIASIGTVQNGAVSTPWLTLSYELKGWNFTFDALTAGANWRDSFDMTMALETPVPELPFGFAPNVTATGSNSQFGPNDWEASFDAGFDNFITGFWNQISGGMYKSTYDYVQQAIENQTDASQSFAISNPLFDGLQQLNKEGPETVATGFTQFVVSLDKGQLIATLTHPLDPGPVIQDATNPAGVDLNLAALATSDSVVPPGGTLNVTGTRFPLPNSTQLYLEWPNTASGTIHGDLSSELMITGGGVSQQLHIVPLATGPVQPGMAYTYTATGLTAGAEYSFVARCRDTAAWSLWSKEPLKLTTGQSDTVDLILQGGPGSTFKPVQVGTANLTANSGNWSSHVVIPSSTPPGSYVLAAELNGQTLATLNLTVGAVTAHVNLIDANNQVIGDPVVLHEASFKLRGEGFPNNATVVLTIDGQQVAQTTAVNGQFIQTLTTPATKTGNLTVTATGGGATASTMYQQLGIIG